MDPIRAVLYGVLLPSLVVVPAYVTVQLTVLGRPTVGSPGFYVVAAIVFAPGLLMGLGGALVAAAG